MQNYARKLIRIQTYNSHTTLAMIKGLSTGGCAPLDLMVRQGADLGEGGGWGRWLSTHPLFQAIGPLYLINDTLTIKIFRLAL